ncbi:hypothetical protein AB0N73_01815 [Microbacterium sp. NPDC089189]|uniref:hypothetical protein n=1 Tax=Microbacterium sp. NPDC089189 TaxID=3154972 RepID=UPI0034269EFE
MSNTDVKDRRSIIIRSSIGALAVLGLAGAITTAAWTDQAFFSAPATAASFDLQAGLSETGPFTENATAGDALTIPLATSQFGDLVPGDAPLSVDVYVKNASSVPAQLTVDATTSGTLFTAADSTVTLVATPATTTVAPGAVAPVTITLTPGAMPDSLQSATGTVLVTVTGATA